MDQLFEEWPVSESLLAWYPLSILVAELTLAFVTCNVDDSIQQHVIYVSTSFFLTFVSLETWHFMILYALAIRYD